MTKEVKEKILDGIVWETFPKRPTGGQTCGIPVTGFKLSHPDFRFEVTCYDFRSQTQNRQMCLTLFELFLMEVR